MFLPYLLRSPIGWLVILGALAYLYFGGALQRFTGSETQGSGGRAADEPAQFVGFVLDDAQNTWSRIFSERGGTAYRRTKLVLFTDATPTGCGYGRSATGPFYCPRDERVYIDLGFYHELAQRFGARGDFAQAYVMAHEIGHHVQHILGDGSRRGARDEGESGGSVRVELQADCYAGVWAKSTQTRHLLEPGDLDEALRAASAIGDDRLQRQGQGRVQPESWTHGSSEQRTRWLKRGYELGTLEGCDTFSATKL